MAGDPMNREMLDRLARAAKGYQDAFELLASGDACKIVMRPETATAMARPKTTGAVA